MKLLTVLTVLVAGLMAAASASAATGSGSASMLMGSVSIDVAAGATFNVSATPTVFVPGESQQDAWNAAYQSVELDHPGPVDVYTIACWQLDVTAPLIVGGGGSVWKCAVADSGPAASLGDALAQKATVNLGTDHLQMCSWLGAYDPTTNSCLPTPGDAYGAGVDSPAISGDMLPDLDAFVGQLVTFRVTTNWCSFLAPAGYDVPRNNGYSGATPNALGCANQEYGISLASLGGGTRTLAASGSQLQKQVVVRVKASASDCRVPRVKGLTLRQARSRLLAHHCSVGRVVARGGLAGRVRYQPLKVGAGRPRGYAVTLVVGR